MKISITYIIKQFRSFDIKSSDIRIKCFYSSFSIIMKTTPALITKKNNQCAMCRLYCGNYCQCKRATGSAD